MIDINEVEAVWILTNVVTLVLTALALADAAEDRRAVREINGAARSLAADANVRRDGARVVVQTLPVVLLVSSAYDWRDRRRLARLSEEPD